MQIQPIQSQLFHDRRQGPKETVDEYAEALKKLFAKAYSKLARGGQVAESMAQSVLANQFEAGLRPELKSKVVGSDGNLEQLMMKARFEEVKRKELAMATPSNSNQRKFGDQKGASQLLSVKNQLPEVQTNKAGKSGSNTKGCFNCGLTTHLVLSEQPKRDREAHGINSAVSVVAPANETQMILDQIATLQKELKEKEVAAGGGDAQSYYS